MKLGTYEREDVGSFECDCKLVCAFDGGVSVYDIIWDTFELLASERNCALRATNQYESNNT